MKKLLLFSLATCVSLCAAAQTVLIAYGSGWKYLDNGSNQGTAWKATGFNDNGWATGNAELGYGDGDEATVVSYGGNSKKKYITTYFRKTIAVSGTSAFSDITINIRRDDGAVVYINGIERFRTNMPSGSVSYSTKASTDVPDDGNIAQTVTIPASVLVNGNNVIAVEIHQFSRNNADISFDLQLTASGDNIAPLISSLSPSDNATNVDVSADLTMTFNEPMKKGTGNVLIKENGTLFQSVDVTSAAISISGSTITIVHNALTGAASVNIEMPAGVFTDISDNAFAGITTTTGWNFSITAPDITAPVATNFSPNDNASNISVSSNLLLTFNEAIKKGSGNFVIKENDVVSQTIAVTNTAVSISGNVVTINPADFGNDKNISVEIVAGSILDLANNPFAGISNTSTWNFSTEEPVSGPQTFVSFGDVWKYLDNGTNQGTAWRNLAFNDGGWASGPGQLGYGDGDEATVISYGPSSTSKYITSYFRKTISVSNPAAFAAIAGRVKRDDGIVLYVNGTEVYRNNMPAGSVTNATLASAAASDDGNSEQLFSIATAFFVAGTNVIAVEIHQNAGTSSDLSFDLQLIGTVPGFASLTRGPYLNTALQTGIVLRWKTDAATDSKVYYGTSAGSLTQSVTDNTSTTDHVITLTGLSANTLYYYNIGSVSQVLQGDANNHFKTLPPTGSTEKIRFLAMGDMGNNSANQVNVRNAWLNFNTGNYTNGWILMGDNAYSNGLETEYQNNFFNIYQGSLTKNHVLWPSPGNHDYANSATRQADHAIPYYDIFTLPKNGEAGGIASNTEAYYSYNYGNVHFVALDSYGWETGSTRLYDTLGPQAVWLKQDLAANNQQWTVVYFHHPPYTKGSHNSDTESELINMRQRIVPILERYKVDLVLNGHSHSYERSFLLNGHYGLETTFNAGSHALSSSSAKYDGTNGSCTYIKNTADVRNGIVYALVGSAGQNGGSSTGYPHDAMYYSNVSNGGALYLEIENNRLNSKWVCADGVVRDNFTIMKNVNKTTTISINAGTAVPISASWIGNYSWSTGATSKTITVSPQQNTTYTVTDNMGCLTDVINIEVAQPFTSANKAKGIPENDFIVFPTEIKQGQLLNIESKLAKPTAYILADVNGRVIRKNTFTTKGTLQSGQLLPGIYFLKFFYGNKIVVRKFNVLK